MESPKPTKASSAMTVMLFDLRSRCRSRCSDLSASLGISCRLLSPRRKYCRSSAQTQQAKKLSIRARHSCGHRGGQLTQIVSLHTHILVRCRVNVNYTGRTKGGGVSAVVLCAIVCVLLIHNTRTMARASLCRLFLP
jgi:hypothetical protein